jgi:hypothetical protein
VEGGGEFGREKREERREREKVEGKEESSARVEGEVEVDAWGMNKGEKWSPAEATFPDDARLRDAHLCPVGLCSASSMLGSVMRDLDRLCRNKRRNHSTEIKTSGQFGMELQN